MNALRLFAGRCARATRKKSLRPSKSAPASFSPHEEVERRRAQRAPGRWSYRPRRVASESGPFRSTASLVAKTGAGRRRLKLSLHFELMADACPLPLSSNWLKSNLEAARIGRRLLERRARDARSFGELPSFPNDKEPRARARTPTIHHRAHLRAVLGLATGQSGPSPFGLPQASHPRPGDLGEARSDFGVRLRLSPDRRGRVFGHRDSGPRRRVDRARGDGGAQADSALSLRSIHRS